MPNSRKVAHKTEKYSLSNIDLLLFIDIKFVCEWKWFGGKRKVCCMRLRVNFSILLMTFSRHWLKNFCFEWITIRFVWRIKANVLFQFTRQICFSSGQLTFYAVPLRSVELWNFHNEGSKPRVFAIGLAYITSLTHCQHI